MTAAVEQTAPSSDRTLVGSLLVVLALVLAACTETQPITAPPEQPEPRDPPARAAFLDYVPADTRNVFLAPVEGRPQPFSPPPIEVYGGEARLSGRVLHEGAPVAGATVQLERFVGSRSGSVQLVSTEDGGFTARDIRGGRYRIRAWLGDELTLPEAETLFLGEKEERDLTLELIEVPRTERILVVASTEPSRPPVGTQVTLRLEARRQVIAPDGTTEEDEALAAAEVRLVSHPGWEVTGSKTATTSGSGVVTFGATCTESGAHTARVEVAGGERSVVLPACAGDDDGPDPVRFPVGEELTVPFAGPLPPGTYEATDGGPCGVTYQRWTGSDWSSRETTRGRTMTFGDVVRRLEPAPGTEPCTYVRTA